MAGEHHTRKFLGYVLTIDDTDALMGSSEADHRAAARKEDQGGRGLYSATETDGRSTSTV